MNIMLKKFRKQKAKQTAMAMVVQSKSMEYSSLDSIQCEPIYLHSSASGRLANCFVPTTVTEARNYAKCMGSGVSYRGEGVRTVVLSRTKKGYGFVLRGAKGELCVELFHL